MNCYGLALRAIDVNKFIENQSSFNHVFRCSFLFKPSFLHEKLSNDIFGTLLYINDFVYVHQKTK